MIIVLIFVIGLFTLALIFAPALIVAIMKLTVLAVVCYTITSIFMRQKEISFLIIILYTFGVIQMGAQFIGPKIEDINKKVDTINKVVDKVEKVQKIKERSNYYADKNGRVKPVR